MVNAKPVDKFGQKHGPEQKPSFSDIKRMDDRVVLDLDPEKHPLANKDLNELHGYLVPFIKAGQTVEKKLSSAWGIDIKFKKINLNVTGPFNSFSASDQINCYFGKPSEYPEIFASPSALYAHELCHLVSFFDENGNIRSPYESGSKDRREAARSRLNSAGDLPCKYYDALPYHLLPSNMLFADDGKRMYGLYYFANEMVATKGALQLCGRKEAKELVRGLIETDHVGKNPYGMMYLLVLADKFGLHKYDGVMMSKVKAQESEWSGTISTEDLLKAMSQFFDSVSLKHQ